MMKDPVWDEEACLLVFPGSNFINLTTLREAKVLEERKPRLKVESASTGKVAAFKNWLWKTLMTVAMKICKEFKQDIYIKCELDELGRSMPLTWQSQVKIYEKTFGMGMSFEKIKLKFPLSEVRKLTSAAALSQYPPTGSSPNNEKYPPTGSPSNYEEYPPANMQQTTGSPPNYEEHPPPGFSPNYKEHPPTGSSPN